MTDAVPTPEARSGTRLDIRFTGSGSEYFRIWIVNLLFTVLTLGLYFPWAKARRLRYFHENTLVGGSPLAFHGNPRRMVRGYLLVGGLSLLYSVLSKMAPLAGFATLAVIGLMAPALLHAALRFRLGQTSWRGLRLRFTGTVGQAYRVFLPALLPLVLMAVVLGLLFLSASSGAFKPATTATDAPDEPTSSTLLQLLPLALMLCSLTVVPWIICRLKRYQHSGYALGREVTQLDVSAGQIYKVYTRASGVAAVTVVGTILVASAVIALLTVGLEAAMSVLGNLGDHFPAQGRDGNWGGILVAIGLGLAALLVFYPLMLAVPGSYLASRMQNLIWNHTRSDSVHFRSDLRMGLLLGLTLKNILLVALTLGLYWPFAQIANARLRLESIGMDVDVPVEQLTAAAADGRVDATGEAADDLLGIDIDL